MSSKQENYVRHSPKDKEEQIEEETVAPAKSISKKEKIINSLALGASYACNLYTLTDRLLTGQSIDVTSQGSSFFSGANAQAYFDLYFVASKTRGRIIITTFDGVGKMRTPCREFYNLCSPPKKGRVSYKSGFFSTGLRGTQLFLQAAEKENVTVENYLYLLFPSLFLFCFALRKNGYVR